VRIKILLNPYANRWAAKAKAPEIELACQAADLDFELSTIPAPGKGGMEARKALDDGFDAVVAAGGDGTVSEVVNGLIIAAGDSPTAPMGVLPLGTGNDFSDMSSLPRDLIEATRIISKGHTVQVDAGRVTADNQVHFFDNNCALAMEPMVTIEHIRMTRTSGNIRYVIALFKALVKLKAWQMELHWEQGDYTGSAFLLSICNSPRTGGLFPMAPGASMNDGLLDFVFVPEVSKFVVVTLLAKLFRGRHINDSRVTHAQTPYLDVKCEPASPIHADGEIITEGARHIEYQIMPGKITLFAPET
jgi:diacylglycerol kinase (ATP)